MTVAARSRITTLAMLAAAIAAGCGDHAKRRSAAHILSMARKAIGGRDPGAAPIFDEAAAAGDASERAGRAAQDLVAIRTDVMAATNLRGLDRDGVEELVATVMRRL